MVTEAENELLQREFEEQEVLACLKMCAMDKAPGPDGYTMVYFYQVLECSEEGYHGYL